jgi:hypothetical protein
VVGKYNRDVSRRKAIRKKRLAKEICWSPPGWEYYDNLHQFSKNKIHCSCGMCSTKTRNKGKRNKKNYHRAINYKGSDMRKMISMDDQMEEFTGQKIHRKTKSW